MRIVILLALLIALPGNLHAQAGLGSSDREKVSGTAAFLMKGGQIADAYRIHLGGWAGVVFAENLAVGGGGFGLLKQVEIEGTGGGTGFNLDFGYGGFFFRYWEPLADKVRGEAGALLGAGHAEVRDLLTRTEVGSDNFLVAEAELGILYTIFPRVDAGLSLGYRLTTDVDDLPGVTARDLNSFTGAFTFRIGGR